MTTVNADPVLVLEMLNEAAATDPLLRTQIERAFWKAAATQAINQLQQARGDNLEPCEGCDDDASSP